jgi:aubergine
METAIQAIRPGYCESGSPVPILCNYFRFNTKQLTSVLQRYCVAFSPEISSSLSKQRERVLFRAKAKIIEHIGRFVFANTILFSSQTSEEFVVESKYDEVCYSITITPTGELNSPLEIKHFYNKFFNSVQGMLKLVMIGRKFYNPERAVDLPQHKLTVWPGYFNSVGYYEQGCLLNIDISHRCLRTITVYDQILEIKRRSSNDFHSSVSKLLIGASVLTLYNKKCYKVDDIEWDMSPSSSFEKEGKSTDFKSYYTTRWGREIKYDDQPLLKSKLKTMQCYLLPEFCVMTGLTDEIRADFNIMKDLAQATKKEPKARLRESAGLIETLKSFPKTRDEINDWKLDISSEPIALTGRVVSAGSIIMGDNNSFRINESSGSFDRDIQRKMYSQPKLDKWGVFYCEADKRLVEQSLMSNLQQVIKSFNVVCDKPAMFAVHSDKWQDWDRILRQNLNPTVKIVICVLPGSRNKSKLYDDLKRLTFSSYPVPTQCILNATLKKDKGLRSIINKVVLQINAKVGGIPWALSTLPFADTVCMVIGIDIFTKKSNPGVLGFSATMDSNFAKYGSFPKIIMPGGDVFGKIRESTEQALVQFKNENSRFPQIIVVFRDGVSDSQRASVLVDEVGAMKEAFNSIKTSNPDFAIPGLIYNVVNKRTNARFYYEQNGVTSNPPLGTIIDTQVVDKSGYDFYVMPAKANQGSMTPTHFHIVYDDTGRKCDDIQTLSYRLCYSYYNWSGSIRVPAPCQYAHKLAYNYGERSDKNGPPQPHNHWMNSRSLYFL